jgi:hypothetical protein
LRNRDRHAPRAGFALGAGGVGEVDQARDTRLDRVAAIGLLATSPFLRSRGFYVPYAVP